MIDADLTYRILIALVFAVPTALAICGLAIDAIKAVDDLP